MKKSHIIILMSVVFSVLFWRENLGLNLVLFAGIAIGAHYILNPQGFKNKTALMILAGIVLSMASCLVYDSIIAKISLIASTYLFIMVMHLQVFESIALACRQFINTYLNVPESIIAGLRGNSTVNSRPTRKLWYYTRMFAIPIVFLFIFYLLFYNSSTAFHEIAGYITGKISVLFRVVFVDFSFELLCFTLLGLFVSAGIVSGHNPAKLIAQFAHKKTTLGRRSLPKYNGLLFPQLISTLKNEYNIAVILVALINIMVLVLNITDIYSIWFRFEYIGGFDLKLFVHQGTYLLIISILLSMAITLYFFRGSINFYSKNGLLKNLTYVWMAQNIVLCISVMIRNYHYIHIHGMAYKRIGVIIFLLLTLCGIILLIIKIKDKRSNRYVFRKNTWAAYLMLVGMSMIDWDMQMAKFNLHHWNKEGIDIDFYHTLSVKALPLILKNKNIIQEQINANNLAGNHRYYLTTMDAFMNVANLRKKEFLEEQALLGWQSFNFMDHKTRIELNAIQ